jgi:hypothetical protein
MKVKKNNIVPFLKKIKMKDEQEIQQCLMDFNEEGLRIIATSPGSHARVSGILRTIAFSEYQIIGKIGINDFPKFIEILNRIDGDIGMNLIGNELVIFDTETKIRTKVVGIPLIHEDFFNERPDPILTYVDTFDFTMKSLLEVFEDALINKDSKIIIKTEPGKIIFFNTGKYKFRNEFPTNSILLGTKSSFGKPLISALKSLDENIKIHLGDEYPLEVHEDTRISHISIIVAPMASKDEEEGETEVKKG